MCVCARVSKFEGTPFQVASKGDPKGGFQHLGHFFPLTVPSGIFGRPFAQDVDGWGGAAVPDPAPHPLRLRGCGVPGLGRLNGRFGVRGSGDSRNFEWQARFLSMFCF